MTQYPMVPPVVVAEIIQVPQRRLPFLRSRRGCDDLRGSFKASDSSAVDRDDSRAQTLTLMHELSSSEETQGTARTKLCQEQTLLILDANCASKTEEEDQASLCRSVGEQPLAGVPCNSSTVSSFIASRTSTSPNAVVDRYSAPPSPIKLKRPCKGLGHPHRRGIISGC